MEKLRSISRKNINEKLWNNCVNQYANDKPYCFTWYLDALCPQWKGLVYGDYEAVFPITPHRFLGSLFWVQPFFCQQFTICAPTTLYIYFIHYIQAQFKLDICFDKEYSFDKKLIIERNNYELNLNLTYDELKSRFHQNHIRNFKKGNWQNKNITISNRFYAIMHLYWEFSAKQYPQVKKIKTQLNDLLSFCNKNDLLENIECLDESQNLICGAIFLKCKHRRVFLLSANSPEGKTQFALFGLLNFYIQKNANHDLILDFEGSDNPDTARFYKGFGAENSPYFRIQKRYF